MYEGFDFNIYIILHFFKDQQGYFTTATTRCSANSFHI